MSHARLQRRRAETQFAPLHIKPLKSIASYWAEHRGGGGASHCSAHTLANSHSHTHTDVYKYTVGFKKKIKMLECHEPKSNSQVGTRARRISSPFHAPHGGQKLILKNIFNRLISIIPHESGESRLIESVRVTAPHHREKGFNDIYPLNHVRADHYESLPLLSPPLSSLSLFLPLKCIHSQRSSSVLIG